MQPKLCLLLMAGMFASDTVSMAAHHSFSSTYLEDQVIAIEGDLVDVVYRNPHSFIHLRVRLIPPVRRACGRSSAAIAVNFASKVPSNRYSSPETTWSSPAARAAMPAHGVCACAPSSGRKTGGGGVPPANDQLPRSAGRPDRQPIGRRSRAAAHPGCRRRRKRLRRPSRRGSKEKGYDAVIARTGEDAFFSSAPRPSMWCCSIWGCRGETGFRSSRR